MTGIRRLPILAALILLATVATRAPHPAAGDTLHAPHTPQYRGTAEHGDSSFPHTFNPDTISLEWFYDPASDGLAGGFSSDTQPCVSADGSLVFAKGNTDGTPFPTDPTSKIIAIDTSDGAKAWELDVVAYNDFGTLSSPVYSRGYVYWVGSNGAGVTTVYKIHAPTGSTSAAMGGWQVTMPYTMEVVNCTPTIAECLLFFSSYADFFAGPETTVHFALDLRDGSIVWANPDGGQGQGAMAYVPDRGYVVASIYDEEADAPRLRAYHAASGYTAWTSDFTLTETNVELAIAHHNGRLYVQDTNFGTGSLYCVTAGNGKLQWQAALDRSGTGVPAIDESGNVYCCGTADFANDNAVYAFDSSGNAIAGFDGSGSGGHTVSVTCADGCLLVGYSTSGVLRILDATDGSLITSIAGYGPVAFGRNRIYSIDTAGVLQAHNCGSLFASEVAGFTQGAGQAGFNDPDTALGRPTVLTDGTAGAPPEVVVVAACPPTQTDEIVSIGDGGNLDLRFDQRIIDDPNNPHGIDFIVFGNAFMTAGGATYQNEEDPTGYTLDGAIFEEPGIVAVSQDGVKWFTFAAPSADTFAPSFGRVYDEAAPDAGLGAWNLWWSARETNANLPIDPTLTAADFNGQTVAQMAQTFGDSAGGTGFDLADVGLSWCRYVRITTDGETAEIDAVSIVVPEGADTTAPPDASSVTATLRGTTATVKWTLPDSADADTVLVLRSVGTADVDPADGIDYCPGDLLGTALVVYVGPAASFRDYGVADEPLPTYTVYVADAVLNYSGPASAIAVVQSDTGSGSGDGSGCAAVVGGGAGAGVWQWLAWLVLLVALGAVRRRT